MIRGVFDGLLTFLGFNKRAEEKRRLEDDEGISRASKIRRIEDPNAPGSQVRMTHISNALVYDSLGSYNNPVRITDWEHDGKENVIKSSKHNHHSFAHHPDVRKRDKLSPSPSDKVQAIGQTVCANSERRLRETSQVSGSKCVMGSETSVCFAGSSMNPDFEIIHDVPKQNNYHRGGEVNMPKKPFSSGFDRATHHPRGSNIENFGLSARENFSSRANLHKPRKFSWPNQHRHNLQSEVQILQPTNRILNSVDMSSKSQTVSRLDSLSSRCRSTLDHEKRAENISKYNEVMRQTICRSPKEAGYSSRFNGPKSSDDGIHCLGGEKETMKLNLGMPQIKNYLSPVINEKLNILVDRKKEAQPSTPALRKQNDEIRTTGPRCSPRKASSSSSEVDNFMQRLIISMEEFHEKERLKQSLLAEKNKEVMLLSKLNEQKRLERSKSREKDITDRLARYLFITEDFKDEEPETPAPLPELTSQMESEISAALSAPENKPLVDAFNITIKGRDMHTLRPVTWLNDEIINFYMNLLIERGKNDNYPSVYAFNTFFYPKLTSTGFSSLKRWTRRVDIFDHDFLVIPVHLGQHWCMAIVDMKAKQIRYYDSLKGKDHNCLKALFKYLEDEHIDKKKTPFDATGWVKEIANDIPEQRNGSDCGMFSCMYAEYVTRKAQITFSQDDMPYFRRKMVYEILHKKLFS